MRFPIFLHFLMFENQNGNAEFQEREKVTVQMIVNPKNNLLKF